MDLVAIIQEIANLQQKYSSQNTPEMKRRGHLIRQELPKALGKFSASFQNALGVFSADIDIEGRDGIGRKTQAPWVRIHSRELSPSATTGYYVVIHFSTDGNLCFITLGCGATRWDSEKGDLSPYSDEDLNKQIDWAREMLKRDGKNVQIFPDTIAIGSEADLPKRFEKATILCKTHRVSHLNQTDFIEDTSQMLDMLKVLYERQSEHADISSSETITTDVDRIANPNRASNRQGYGLTAEERKAVELQGMSITAEFLKAEGYTLKDTSANKPYDFLAKKGQEEIKVEVKATTSSELDAFLMTHGEVTLHENEAGFTALALIHSVRISERGRKPKCEGGELEFISPWDISNWDLRPRVFEVKRNKE